MFGEVLRTNPLECFLEVIEKRNRATLLDMIKKKIRPSRIIESDS